MKPRITRMGHAFGTHCTLDFGAKTYEQAIKKSWRRFQLWKSSTVDQKLVKNDQNLASKFNCGTFTPIFPSRNFTTLLILSQGGGVAQPGQIWRRFLVIFYELIFTGQVQQNDRNFRVQKFTVVKYRHSTPISNINDLSSKSEDIV